MLFAIVDMVISYYHEIEALEKLNKEGAMIKIMKEKLNRGISLLKITKNCPNSHNCLWSRRPGLFHAPHLLPKGCPREKCEVVIFRKAFEDDSPAFYAEALKLSQFAGVVRATVALTVEKKESKRKRQKKLIRRTHDLHVFGELLVLAIYPLFLETKEIPFLSSAEIANLKNGHRDAEICQTLQRMNEINPEWSEWVKSTAKNLLATYERYPLAIIYLVCLFLKGLEKTQLPDLQAMSLQDKEKFFSELMSSISQK